jgi:hypothetical protein
VKYKKLCNFAIPIALLMMALPALGQKPEQVDRPFETRKPVCVSLFLKQDFRLNTKQEFCDFAQNRVFTLSGTFGAAFSAGYSQITERSQDRGKGTTGYSTRFGEDMAQSAFKSTGTLLGGFILHEDPRPDPPYLVLRHSNEPKGFWQRSRHAVSRVLLSYQCVKDCTTEQDIKRRFGFSHVAGAFASGFSSELWAPDRLNDPWRAIRRSGSAYATTFGSSFFSEFNPELTTLGHKVLGIFGIR